MLHEGLAAVLLIVYAIRSGEQYGRAITTTFFLRRFGSAFNCFGMVYCRANSRKVIEMNCGVSGRIT